MRDLDVLVSRVVPPRNYRVERVAFQRWVVVAPNEQVLDEEFQLERHAAQRAHRHLSQLDW